MGLALYKKLRITKEELAKKIQELYNSGLSQSKIAEKFGCHLGCIEDYFKEFHLKGRNSSDASRIVKQRNCKLTKIELEVINGLMLSDLYIESGSFQARFSFGVRHKEFCKAIISNIPSIEWIDIYPYKSNRTPNINYFGKSKYYVELLELHNKWYDKRKKIVPKDIVLTPNVLYWWFIGDGYIETRGYGLFLCTESFPKDDNLLLVDKLNKLDFNCFLTKRNRIRFRGQNEMRKFLRYIGKSTLKCYEYKWAKY